MLLVFVPGVGVGSLFILASFLAATYRKLLSMSQFELTLADMHAFEP